ncbi:hypothetical protein WBP06_20555 [Novosphingobium sp. BL-8H]|uniref:hypothetical protein n=1 Tax=Novosphingobium sp. BL-8H TaxID=3127640 RepID=UPI0037563CA3
MIATEPRFEYRQSPVNRLVRSTSVVRLAAEGDEMAVPVANCGAQRDFERMLLDTVDQRDVNTSMLADTVQSGASVPQFALESTREQQFEVITQSMLNLRRRGRSDASRSEI